MSNEDSFFDRLNDDQIVPGPDRPKIKRQKLLEYSTLGQLHSKLIDTIKEELQHGLETNAMIPYQCFVYGIVEKLELISTEICYVIRIKDETMSNVRVRIVGRNKKDSGPIIREKDIIRIHRLTAQVEYNDEMDRKEMVLSTSPHHNYILFKVDNAGTVKSKSSAKNPSWTLEAQRRVLKLSRFLKVCDRREERQKKKNSTRIAVAAVPIAIEEPIPVQVVGDIINGELVRNSQEEILEQAVETNRNVEAAGEINSQGSVASLGLTQIHNIPSEMICKIVDLRFLYQGESLEVHFRVQPLTVLKAPKTRRLFICEEKDKESTIDIQGLHFQDDGGPLERIRPLCGKNRTVRLQGLRLDCNDMDEPVFVLEADNMVVEEQISSQLEESNDNDNGDDSESESEDMDEEQPSTSNNSRCQKRNSSSDSESGYFLRESPKRPKLTFSKK